MKCDFSLKHYENTLRLAKNKGYIFVLMRDYDKYINNKKMIFLRHDVDSKVSNTINFAEIEHKLGIKATYFFRVHGRYNLFSLENYKIIKQILRLGHEIGLHFEGGFANIFNETERTMFKKSMNILKIIVGKNISGYTSHQPVKNGKIEFQSGYYDGYNKRFVKDIKYISDSGGRWREGCMCDFIKNNVPKLCILTHSFWGYKKTSLEVF